jgi:hypothetical protein
LDCSIEFLIVFKNWRNFHENFWELRIECKSAGLKDIWSPSTIVPKVFNALVRSVSKKFFGIGSVENRPMFHIPIVDLFADLSEMKNS